MLCNLYRAVSVYIFFQVGTNFDPKEQLFRNFAGLIGSDDEVAFKFTWRRSTSGFTTMPRVNLVLFYPNGTDASDVHIEVSISEDSGLSAVTVHRLPPSFPRPLAPGIWTARITATRNVTDGETVSEKPTVVAELRFLVAPTSPGLSAPGSGIFPELVSSAWRVIGTCLVTGERKTSSWCMTEVSACRQTPWSTHYPDPKSWLSFPRLTGNS